MKIVDKIAERLAQKQPVYSFEFFPPKTRPGIENLYLRINKMTDMDPTWIDVTWGAGGQTSDTTMEIAANVQKYCGVDVMMHLTCTNMTKKKLRQVLQQAKDSGIENILALRGDPVRGCVWAPIEGGFEHAVELVRFIREEFGQHFCIGVAGYPEGWHAAESAEEGIRYLKEKVDAGANIILTQLFYKSNVYKMFLDECRNHGINCPIIPGIMPIQSFRAFCSMTKYCNCGVPPSLMEKLRQARDDDSAVRQIGVEIMIEVCRDCLDAGAVGLHFYTLNLEGAVRRIIYGLGERKEVAQETSRNGEDTNADESKAFKSEKTATAVQSVNISSATVVGKSAHRMLPWRPSTLAKRKHEAVRPIFWSNRPKSYVQRTESWEEFPNGRWGDHRSPAYGELADSHFYRLMCGSEEDRRSEWGEAPLLENEIWDIFAKYMEGTCSRLPWCAEPLQKETAKIRSPLVELNRKGFLTINSQPRLNGLNSDDPIFGWGGAGGVVYQKAYLEFFTPASHFLKLVEKINKDERFSSLSYHATNYDGSQTSTNCKNAGVAAVTWGVFPGKEVLQPTVVDPEAFMVWKDEAFSLWLEQWASIYDDESVSYDLLHSIHDGYFLVNIVDNNFQGGDIFQIFREFDTPQSIASNETLLK